MKKLAFIVSLLFFSACQKEESTTPADQSTSQERLIQTDLTTVLPKPDHIIFIWFENKGYPQIIGSSSAPFINSLIAQGTLFTNSHALGHPSYPEYIRFFAGTRNGKADDNCISGKPYTNSNLYTQLNAKVKTFAWYSEDLPSIGSTTCSSGYYREKHNPTQCFANVPDSRNKRWIDFPTNFSLLETVVCITPNLIHDMHDGTILQGDQWLQQKCSSLITWCKTHNSIFVVYFDEDNGSYGNLIPAVAVGQHVKVNYKSSTYYDHYNWTRTVLSMYGATQIANTTARTDISDCWN